MIKLRNYQEKIYTNTQQAIIKGLKHLLIYAAMRSGKTVVFSFLAQRMALKNKKCLIVTERIKLFDQTINEISNFGLKPQLINADSKFIDKNQTTFLAMTISLKNRMEKNFFKKWAETIDVIMIDEAHRTIADWIFDHPILSKKIILGFTGSPIRSGKQRQLSDLYQEIIYGPNTIELEKLGQVAKLKIFSIPFDKSSFKVDNTSNGYEYNVSSMFNAMNRPELYKGVVNNYKIHTLNTMAICYNVSIIHAINTCIEFNKQGIKSKFITSELQKPKLKNDYTSADLIKYQKKLEEYEFYKKNYNIYSGDEKQILNEWVKGEFLVLQNVDKYTFGFNEPRLVTVIVNRGTLSLPLWIQMANRSTTKCEGKSEAYLIDMAGNYYQLLAPNYPHTWSLHHEQSKSSGGAPPVKECGKMGEKKKVDKHDNHGCGCYVFASSRICAFCGYVFEQDKELKFAELIEINYSEPLPIERNLFDELEREAESRGYKFGWVLNMIIAKQGEQGLKDYAKSRNYQSGWFWQTKRRYEKQIKEYERSISGK